jgi:hypothetical protein
MHRLRGYYSTERIWRHAPITHPGQHVRKQYKCRARRPGRIHLKITRRHMFWQEKRTNRFPDFFPRQFSYFLLDQTRL